MSEKILFIQPSGKTVRVSPENFEAAMNEGFEPAFEMSEPTGKIRVVRKSNYDAAIKSGLKPRPVAEAEKKAESSFNDGSDNQVGYPETAARGFANLTTFGAADEIGGASDAVKAFFQGHPVGEAFQKGTDRYRKRDDAAYEQNPKTYIGGGAVGVLPQMAGGAIARPVLGAALQGAAGGFAGGTDYREPEDDELTDRLKEAAFGGVAGAGVAKAFSALGSRTTKNLEPAADTLAYRATGALKADLNKLYGAGTDKAKEAREIGRVLREEGIVKPFSKRGGEQITEGIENSLGKYRSSQDEFLLGLDTAAGQEGSVPFEDIAQKITAEIRDARSRPGAANQSYANALEKELEILAERQPRTNGTPKNITPNSQPVLEKDAAKMRVEDFQTGMKEMFGGGNQSSQQRPYTFTEATEAKRAFDQGGKFQSNTDAAAVQAARTVRRAIKDTIDENISKVAGGEDAAKYRAERMNSKRLIDAKKAIEQNTQRESANKIFGLTDSITTGPAAMVGYTQGGLDEAAIYAGAALLLKKTAESYGDAMLSSVFGAAAEGIKRYGLEETAKRLNQTVGPQVTNQVMQQIMSESEKQ